MYNTRLTIILSSLLFFFPIVFQAQQKAKLSAEEVNDYIEQTKQLVKYLEGTLNFIGDPSQVPSEKDIIINNSYLKMFQSDETQIEDDLDPNREMALNKDVQAYLKDVDFFFKHVTFTFEVNSVDQLVNDNGEIYFKVTMNRNLQGVTIDNDSLNNNQIRYIEINLDAVQKDLKIVSMYTTKPDRRMELKYWWEQMAEGWRGFFGDSIQIIFPTIDTLAVAGDEFDTIAFSEILSFTDSAFVYGTWHEDMRTDSLMVYDGDTLMFGQVADSIYYLGDTIIDTTTHYLKVYDTIPTKVENIYKNLETFVAFKSIDISGNEALLTLKPLSELNELVEINFSNTLITDISPLRNLNKLEIINCSGSKVNTLEQLRYAIDLREIDCSNTPVENIDVLANLTNLNKLSIRNTKVKDIASLSEVSALGQLDVSELDLNDFSALENLESLADLNISSTSVTDLASIGKIRALQSLNIGHTYVTRLDPLKELQSLSVLQANSSRISVLDPLTGMETLKFIYCDSTGIDGKKAEQFMSDNSNCLVIYNTKELEQWWIDLPAVYKSIISERMHISDPVTTEQLHLIINQTNVDLSNRKDIESIEPLGMLHRLETINLENTGVTDLKPLGNANNLRELNINNTQVIRFDELQSLRNLKLVKCENTSIADLLPLSGNTNLQQIYCDGSGVEQSNVLKLRETLPGCLVIYQSKKLENWWGQLSSEWKKIFEGQFKFNDDYGAVNLQSLVNLTKVSVVDRATIKDLEPLSWFMSVEVLSVSNTKVSSIDPLLKLPYLNELNLPNNPIFQVDGIAGLVSLRILNLENTSIEDLSIVGQLSQLTQLNVAGTKVKKLKGIEGMTNLEDLYINNTVIKSLKGIENLGNLKELKCYRTGISSKTIDKFKSTNPGVDVEFY